MDIEYTHICSFRKNKSHHLIKYIYLVIDDIIKWDRGLFGEDPTERKLYYKIQKENETTE